MFKFASNKGREIISLEELYLFRNLTQVERNERHPQEKHTPIFGMAHWMDVTTEKNSIAATFSFEGPILRRQSPF
jgi:hypothetical protein